MSIDESKAMLDLAERIVHAAKNGKLEEIALLYSPHAVNWHNTDKIDRLPADNQTPYKTHHMDS